MAQFLRLQVPKGEIPTKDIKLREAMDDLPKDPKIAELPILHRPNRSQETP